MRVEPLAVYDIYGYVVRVAGSISLLSKFDAYYGPFRKDSLAYRHASVEVMPAETPLPLAISVKGGRTGLALRTKRDGSSEHVEVLYDPRARGTEELLIVNFTRFLMHWEAKFQAHAAAVSKNGSAYVFFAPGNTGKTTLALKLVSDGFSLIGDDWVIIDEAGKAFAYPQPMRIHDYNLASNLEWCRRIFPLRATVMHWAMKARVSLRNNLIPRIPSRAARYGLEWALSRPVREVPVDMMAQSVETSAAIRHAFWLERHPDYAATRLSAMNEDELVSRVNDTYLYEFSEYFKWYYSQSQLGHKIGYLAEAGKDLRRVLIRALARIPCTKVSIPEAASPEHLHGSVTNFLKETYPDFE